MKRRRRCSTRKASRGAFECPLTLAARPATLVGERILEFGPAVTSPGRAAAPPEARPPGPARRPRSFPRCRGLPRVSRVPPPRLIRGAGRMAGCGSTGGRRPPRRTWRTCWRPSCRGCGRGSAARGWTRTWGRAETPLRRPRRGWPGWRGRPSRACWGWAGFRGGDRSGWARRVSAGQTVRRPVPTPTRPRRGGRASISMRAWRSRATGRGSSASVGTSCARR